MKYINLGCGSRFHKDWINIDFISNSTDVIAHNLLNGIPLPDNYSDVIYHSHVLEHFSKSEGINFLRECYRVLNQNGVLRVVVPDLEQIAIEYLTALKNVSENQNKINEANYDWSILELLDQLVRERPGGEMLEYWKQTELINESQIVERVGDEFLSFRHFLIQNKDSKIGQSERLEENTFKSKIKQYLFKKLHVNKENLNLGDFRNKGEIHKWMYDKHSLTRLLEHIGFKDIMVKTAFSSSISDWNKFDFLDVENDRIRKPDSLIIEAIKKG